MEVAIGSLNIETLLFEEPRERYMEHGARSNYGDLIFLCQLSSGDGDILICLQQHF